MSVVSCSIYRQLTTTTDNGPLINMERSHLWRWICVFLTIGSWLLLLFAVGSFHPTDWPSHAVGVYRPVENLCGPVGAFVSYYIFLVFGQGAFPILFFTGVCTVLYVAQNRVSDPWMRAIGLLLLSIAFAATVHHFEPGSENGLPEGQGGILGIGAATYLQAHFSGAGTCLVLLTAMLIGLILVADDLVIKAPVFIGAAIANAKLPRPNFKLNLPSVPRMSQHRNPASRSRA